MALSNRKKNSNSNVKTKRAGGQEGPSMWPVQLERVEVKWFPASSRLIGLVRANVDKFVLPPAVVRKASWRD